MRLSVGPAGGGEGGSGAPAGEGEGAEAADGSAFYEAMTPAAWHALRLATALRRQFPPLKSTRIAAPGADGTGGGGAPAPLLALPATAGEGAEEGGQEGPEGGAEGEAD
eukprot:5991368-Pyramimonas_sp.AAC.1